MTIVRIFLNLLKLKDLYKKVKNNLNLLRIGKKQPSKPDK